MYKSGAIVIAMLFVIALGWSTVAAEEIVTGMLVEAGCGATIGGERSQRRPRRLHGPVRPAW